jgi:hypothetical protein
MVLKLIAQAKHLHRAHEAIINNSQLNDEFKPLDMPNPPRPIRTRLSDDYKIDDPRSFFTMFIRDNRFDILAKNTNSYAVYQLANHSKRHHCRRGWKPTNQQEIKVYIAILLFLGIQRNHSPKSFWENPDRDSPVHRIKWSRYRIIVAFFKISAILDNIDITDTNDIKNADWHKKLSPLDTHLQERFQAAAILRSRLSYDEIMIGWRGRSKHTTKVKGKPQPDGFKVWAIAKKGYLYDWLYYSGIDGMYLSFFR